MKTCRAIYWMIFVGEVMLSLYFVFKAVTMAINPIVGTISLSIDAGYFVMLRCDAHDMIIAIGWYVGTLLIKGFHKNVVRKVFRNVLTREEYNMV